MKNCGELSSRKIWANALSPFGECQKSCTAKGKGNYDSVTSLSLLAKQELQWWKDNALSVQNDISHTVTNIRVASDASHAGWGCVGGVECSGGLWLPVEARFHINYLELKVAHRALKCFQKQLSEKHIRQLLDNSMGVACINKMGTSLKNPVMR